MSLIRTRSFGKNGPRSPSFIVYIMKDGERGPFFPKLRVRIKDNNTSLHGKFRRFLFPFSSKFPDQNFASHVLYIFSCGTRSEPGLPVVLPIIPIGIVAYAFTLVWDNLCRNSCIQYSVQICTMAIMRSAQSPPPFLQLICTATATNNSTILISSRKNPFARNFLSQNTVIVENVTRSNSKRAVFIPARVQSHAN